MTQVSLVPILLWVAALACAGMQSGARGARFCAASSSTGCCVICFSFRSASRGFGLSSDMFFAEQAAASIGWPNTPFQYEVGVANLGLGLASIYAAFRGSEARLAVALAASCFLMGAGIIHILDIIEKGNFAPGNAGPIMITDFLTPIAVLVLLVLANRRRRSRSRPSWKSRARPDANIATR